MDPNLQNIILGLITNGLTSLIFASGKKTGNLLIGKEFLEKWEEEKTALEPLLNKAINAVAETFQMKGPPKEEIVGSILLLPETEEIIRQVYSIKISETSRDFLGSLRQIFLTSFTLFVNSFPDSREFTENDLRKSAYFLFDALVKECNLVLDYAIDKDILSAHEAKSALRFHIITSELAAILKRLEFLKKEQNLDLRSIIGFEKKYRSQVGISHNSITPPSFDSARKLPINDLFVPPRFYAVSRKKQEEEKPITTEEFISRTYRTVLLGNPGGGKSTFSLKICHDLAQQHPNFVYAGRRRLTPILIILREYGADKKDRKCSILEFIETEVKATYQLPSPPAHACEYLLLNGRAMVIFDGLDELLVLLC